MTPIYPYQLTYKSKNSFADFNLGLDSEALGLGVCHVDDLYHMFKVDSYKVIPLQPSHCRGNYLRQPYQTVFIIKESI